MAAGEAQPGPREAEQIWAWSKANAARERKNGCGRVVMDLDKQTVAHFMDESVERLGRTDRPRRLHDKQLVATDPVMWQLAMTMEI